MNEFFKSIYGWFCERSPESIFTIMNTILGEDENVELSSTFPTIGITVIAVSILVAFAFYIWPLNHPRFKAWWAWLIMLILNALINFGLAFAFIDHRIAEINEKGENVWLELEKDTSTITFGDYFDFAISNACVSVIFFILASLILTWFSTTCRYSPFRS